jgi:uncharacterized protein YjbI with pentapeptide repeats
LENADFRDANFELANLNETDLTHANLEGANFVLTSFKGAVLLGTNLTHACNLELHHLAQAKTLYQAKLDGPILEAIKENHPHLLNKPEGGKRVAS